MTKLDPSAEAGTPSGTDAEGNINQRIVTLDEPLKRGETQITKVTVRRPGSGELRGVSLSALGDLDVTALHKVLPRITQPTLTVNDIEKMAPSDLMQLGVVVGAFLLPSAQRREIFQNA